MEPPRQLELPLLCHRWLLLTDEVDNTTDGYGYGTECSNGICARVGRIGLVADRAGLVVIAHMNLRVLTECRLWMSRKGYGKRCNFTGLAQISK